jgi:hypothetical protein
MKQQTAVEYLFEQLWEEPKEKWVWQHYLKKALEMEKSQHNKTAADWWGLGSQHILLFGVDESQTFDEYYKDKFKTNKDVEDNND